MRIHIRATAVTSRDCYVRGMNSTPAYRVMARLALGWNAPRQPVLGMVLSGEVDTIGPDVGRIAADNALSLVGFIDKNRGAYEVMEFVDPVEYARFESLEAAISYFVAATPDAAYGEHPR